jgi:hypothetical protein
MMVKEIQAGKETQSLHPGSKINCYQSILIVFIFGFFFSSVNAQTLKSPNGKVIVHFELKKVGEETGCPVYNVAFEGHPVLAESRLGLQEHSISLSHDFKITGTKTTTVNTTWKPVLAERYNIRVG